jgi:hypothetical protein
MGGDVSLRVHTDWRGAGAGRVRPRPKVAMREARACCGRGVGTSGGCVPLGAGARRLPAGGRPGGGAARAAQPGAKRGARARALGRGSGARAGVRWASGGGRGGGGAAAGLRAGCRKTLGGSGGRGSRAGRPRLAGGRAAGAPPTRGACCARCAGCPRRDCQGTGATEGDGRGGVGRGAAPLAGARTAAGAARGLGGRVEWRRGRVRRCGLAWRAAPGGGPAGGLPGWLALRAVQSQCCGRRRRGVCGRRRSIEKGGPLSGGD